MPAFTLGPDPVARGEVIWPRWGRPTATLLLGVPHDEVNVQVGGQYPLVLRGDGGQLTLAGTVMALDRTPEGWPLVRWVGGRGRLHTEVRPRYYRDAPARVVMADIIRDAGEAVGEMEASVSLPTWVRVGEPAHMALDRVCQAVGVGWWVTPSGEVEVGPEEWAPGGEFAAARMHGPGMWLLPLGLEVQPGTEVSLRLGGRSEQVRVGRVVHRLGRELVTEVWRA